MNNNFIADENIRIDKFLAERLEGITRSRIQHLVEDGNVTVIDASDSDIKTNALSGKAQVTVKNIPSTWATIS